MSPRSTIEAWEPACESCDAAELARCLCGWERFVFGRCDLFLCVCKFNVLCTYVLVRMCRLDLFVRVSVAFAWRLNRLVRIYRFDVLCAYVG